MKKGFITLAVILLCCIGSAAAQDLIVKTDGTKIEAKVLEIGEKEQK